MKCNLKNQIQPLLNINGHDFAAAAAFNTFSPSGLPRQSTKD
jgi:hypothetical protein